MKKIVLVGGGTAGHIMPNLALLPYLKNYDIYYIGAKNKTDEFFLKNYDIKKYFLPVVKLDRKFNIKNIFIPFKLLKNIKLAKKILKSIKPDMVFSKGGFVGLPVCIGCKKLKIPYIIHESDYTLGLSNKLVQKGASKILTTFNDTKTKYPDKTICTGTPIRKEIRHSKLSSVNNFTKLDKKKKTILIVGGSQGSKFFNDFFILNRKKICKIYNIILIAGKQNTINVPLPNNFIKVKNVENIQDYYAVSDFIVTRGGANTIFELLFLNKLMLIIPLSTKNSRGDQIQNANYFVKNGFAEMMFEEDTTIESFLKKINSLSLNSKKYLDMQTKSSYRKANKNIVSAISSLI